MVTELQQVNAGSLLHETALAAMSAEQLVNYIILKHHFYVKQAMPLIYLHVQKVATRHGDRFPYMQRVLNLFSIVQEDMDCHMAKEEQVLFPRIKEAEAAVLGDTTVTVSDAGYISQPIHIMEMEHEDAGNLLAEIRLLTNDYTAPEEACTTFRISLAELKEFEEDL